MSSPQPITQAYQPGRPVVSLIWDMTMDNVWNTNTSAYEAYNPSNAAHYQVSLTDANGVGWYSGAFPSALTGATFQVVTYDTANMLSPIGAAQMGPPDTGGISPASTSAGVISVINKALQFLAVSQITSLSDDSEAAIQANSVYNGILTAVLRSHWWKFASFVQIPSLLSYPAFDATNDSTGDPLPGWEYLYAYPTTCVKLRRVFDPACCGNLGGVGFVSYTYYPDFVEYYDMYKDTLYRWKLVMTPSAPFVKAIAAHVNPAYIEYTYLVTDPTLWDQYFSDAMSWNIAATLARQLTGNTDLATQAMSYTHL